MLPSTKLIIAFAALAMPVLLVISEADNPAGNSEKKRIVTVDGQLQRPKSESAQWPGVIGELPGYRESKPDAEFKLTPATLDSVTLPSTYTDLLTDDDKRFFSLPRNRELENTSGADLKRKLLDMPYIRDPQEADIKCRGSKCLLTGELRTDTSIYNSNIAMTHINTLASDDRSTPLSGENILYFSYGGKSFFRILFHER